MLLAILLFLMFLNRLPATIHNAIQNSIPMRLKFAAGSELPWANNPKECPRRKVTTPSLTHVSGVQNLLVKLGGIVFKIPPCAGPRSSKQVSR